MEQGGATARGAIALAQSPSAPLAHATEDDLPLLGLAKQLKVRHIGIIMDGNGRWATQKGRPRAFGHQAGVEALRQVVQGAADAELEILTVYAFSTENWKRPKSEIMWLFGLLKTYVESDLQRLHASGVRISIIGRRDGLDKDTLEIIAHAEATTAQNTKLHLLIALNYGARAEITDAVAAIAGQVARGDIALGDIDEAMIGRHLYTQSWPDPELIVRTGGDMRLSNFLLWQAAYAEFISTDVFWPDFGASHLRDALIEFGRRVRRFGGL